jgi:hypothetical protein
LITKEFSGVTKHLKEINHNTHGGVPIIERDYDARAVPFDEWEL